MQFLAMFTFFISFAGIVGLFSLKYWEEKNERELIPALRKHADAQALELKQLLLLYKGEMRKVGPASIKLARVLLHDLALSFAALSRASERQAHRLADMVSHKRSFVPREAKNEFLKKVGEYKNTSVELETSV